MATIIVKLTDTDTGVNTAVNPGNSLDSDDSRTTQRVDNNTSDLFRKSGNLVSSPGDIYVITKVEILAEVNVTGGFDDSVDLTAWWISPMGVVTAIKGGLTSEDSIISLDITNMTTPNPHTWQWSDFIGETNLRAILMSRDAGSGGTEAHVDQIYFRITYFAKGKKINTFNRILGSERDD